MAKKAYSSPRFFGLEEGEDPGIILPPSQGTSGEDPQFTWDSAIDSNDIDMFWAAGFDETDLAVMDTNHDLNISWDEWIAWYNEHGTW